LRSAGAAHTGTRADLQQQASSIHAGRTLEKNGR